MATPEMTWLTLYFTTAKACSRPPIEPAMMPSARPVHGPNFHAAHAPNQVPRIIMPSMPMLTMPARSAHRPARPASRMGVVTRSVVSNVPDDVRSVASVMTRVSDSSTSRDAGDDERLRALASAP